MSTPLGVALFVSAAVLFITSIAISSYRDADLNGFNKTPNKIHFNNGTAEYTPIYMKFKSWKKLFDLDPASFYFVKSGGGIVEAPTLYGQSLSKCHPMFVKKDGKKKEYFWIDFTLIEWVKYFFSIPHIINRISLTGEEVITGEILGNVQDKIDAIKAESDKHIQDTLNLQKEILLRMNTNPSEETKDV